jgi:hypothetical protein
MWCTGLRDAGSVLDVVALSAGYLPQRLIAAATWAT